MAALGPVNELSTARLTITVTDEAGDPVPAESLDTLTLTLYRKRGNRAIVNSREGQNVLNANGVTVDAEGLLTWTLEPADNAIVAPTETPIGDNETHVALFAWTYGSGLKAGRGEIEIAVTNLGRTGE